MDELLSVERIADVIIRDGADLVCLQEVERGTHQNPGNQARVLSEPPVNATAVEPDNHVS